MRVHLTPPRNASGLPRGPVRPDALREWRGNVREGWALVVGAVLEGVMVAAQRVASWARWRETKC